MCFAEVCVDKARIDEYEQQASELAQKVTQPLFYCICSSPIL